MTDEYRQGTTATLLAQFYAHPGGPAADVSGLTVTISPAGGGAAVLGPTAVGVTNESTGLYSYAWPIGAGQAVGTYIVEWNADGGIAASEAVAVIDGQDSGTVTTGVSVDLGDVIRLTDLVRTPAGVLSNATTVTLAITLPDGTALSPAPTVTNPPASAGTYLYDYPTTQAGRHVVRWTTTNPVTAYTDVFYVHPAGTTALVGLAEVKAHLNIDAATTTHDDELRAAILVASDVVEGIVGAVARRTVTETHSSRGGPGLALRDGPVLSVTSVTEQGNAVAVDGYTLEHGVLYRVSGYADRNWPRGRGNITVIYTVGRALAAPSVLDSVKELVRINFRPQIGGDYASPFAGEPGDDYAASAGAMRLGFFVPNKIVSLLQAYADPGGFA